MCNMSTENNNNNVTAKKGEEGAAGWGTLEELLLACAVRRHGTNSWDSIATEVRNRGSSNLRASFSSHNCRRKYAELRRRFDGDESEDGDRAAAVVDELRALRVAELRREVCLRDASIVSLQLKVKRLEEEGRCDGHGAEEEEEEENGGAVDGPVDLGKDRLEGGDAAGERGSSPEDVAWKSASAGSYESNSTNQKCEDRRTGEAEKKPERAETAGMQPEMVRDGSNGGGEAEKKSAAEGGGGGESNELDESATESNRREEGGEGVKQSSDVHSAASLSRRPKRRRPPRSGAAVVSSSGEEPEAEEVSPARKPSSSSGAVKSQPLVRILEIIRSHKNGSAFERRLRGQDTERDKMMMIRQPMDLETVQSRLRKGLYSDSTRRFFRDLLLIFNNALILNRKNSPERAAALQLRSLVIKQMAQTPSTDPAPAPNPQPGSLKPDPPDPYLINTQPARTRTRPSPAAVTRKRVAASSSQAQTPPPPENTNKKLLDKRRAAVSVKPKLESPPPPKRAVEGRSITAKKTGNREDKEKEKDKPIVSGKRSRRKSRSFVSESSSSSSDDGNEEEDDENDDDSRSEAERLLPKADRKASKVAAAKKRLGAADFLKRMKQNSPNEKSKFSTDRSNYSNNGEERRAATKDRSARRRAPAAAARREVTAPTLRNNNNNNNNKVKRAVGRPPKKPGAASPSPAKRVRGNGEVEGGSTGRATKRSRR